MDREPRFLKVPEAELQGVARTSLDSPSPTQAQLDRKQRSTALIEALGLPWLETLPVVEDESKLVPRARDEVAARCVATEICAVKGETNDNQMVQLVASSFAARAFFSAEERAFFDNPAPSQRDRARFAWRYECAHVLLWALGYLSDLNPPDVVANVPREAAIFADKGPQHFAPDAELRPLHEILDQTDLYYRLHWAVIHLRLKGAPHPSANEQIIMERHRALNWLIRYMGQSWDHVTTDT